MAQLQAYLEIDKCPHCNVDKPSLHENARFATKTHAGDNERHWVAYVCSRCGGVVTASSHGERGNVGEVYPPSRAVEEAIPSPAQAYLQQAIDSLHAPAGSVMLSASAVDAMLKAKDYKEGSLYSRINEAVDDHLITKEMAIWAHEIRLDANDPRHADEEAPLPSTAAAQRSVDFAMALGEFLYVLPSRVSRGLDEASDQPEEPVQEEDAS